MSVLLPLRFRLIESIILVSKMEVLRDLNRVPGWYLGTFCEILLFPMSLVSSTFCFCSFSTCYKVPYSRLSFFFV